jgi:hypothetical protein
MSAPRPGWADHAQPLQQIGIDLVPLGRPCWCWASGRSASAHEPHQPPDALLVHQMALRCADARSSAGRRRTASPGTARRSGASARGSARLALRHVVERRPRDRQQRHCLPIDRSGWLARSCRASLPPQGLSFRDKKSLATASSPILACSSFTCSSSISGFFLPPRSNTPDAPSSNAASIVDHRRMNPEPARQLRHRRSPFTLPAPPSP